MIAKFGDASLNVRYALGLIGLFAIVFAPAWLRKAGVRIPRGSEFAWAVALSVIYMFFAHENIRSWLLLPAGGWNLLLIVLIGGSAVWVLLPQKGLSYDQPKPTEFYLVASVAGVALGSLAQFYPVPDANHAFWAVVPGLCLLTYVCWRLTDVSEWKCGLLLGLMLLPVTYDKCHWWKYNVAQKRVTMESPAFIRGMRLTPERAEAFHQIDRIVESILVERPGRPAMIYGYDAFYLAWARDRQNPSPYYVTWPLLMSKEERERRSLFLVKEQPILFLQSLSGANQFEEFARSIQYKIAASVVDPADVFLHIAVPAGSIVSPIQEP
jgi:hypothetical protein